MTTLRSVLPATLALALLFFGSVAGTALAPSVRAAAAPSQERAGQMGMMDMSKMQDKAMSDMKSAQGRLDELAKKMNAATGDAKVTAMADVLDELVRQHRATNERMANMDQMMMGQMKMMMR